MKKYLKALQVSMMNIFEYRLDIASNLLMVLLGLAAVFFLWSKIIKDYNEVGGYDLNSIVTYYILSGVFIGFFNTTTTKHLERWIKDGELSSLLIKPVKQMFYLFSIETGSRIGLTILSIIIFLTPVMLIPGLRNTIYIDSHNLFWLFLFIVLSNTFLFFFYWTLGTLAFWILSTGGIRNIANNLLNILKGTWFPLDLAPRAFQNILSFLPFQYAMFYPIKLITSHKTTSENVRGIIVLLVSILISSFISLALWKFGLRRYNSVGN